MEAWRKVWREGILPGLTTEGLTSLLDGLKNDDPALLQGATTSPPPLQCVLDWPVEGGDAIVYSTWKSGKAATVGAAEEFFARTCFEADQRLGEPAAVRYFLNWVDDTPRDEMRARLSEEVERALQSRRQAVAA